MRLETGGDARRVVHEARTAAFAVGEAEQAARDPVVDLLAGRHPDAGDHALVRQHAALGGGERLRRIAALVLEQVAQVLVGGDAEQAAPAREAHRKLEIGEIGAPVGAAQPVLLLGEIVVADPGPMQLAQGRLGRAEIGALAVRLGDVQRHSVDPAAHQRLPRPRTAAAARRRARPRPQARGARARTDGARAAKLHHGTSSMRRSTASTSPVGRAKAAALHGREDVALEHDGAAPALARSRAAGPSAVIPRRRRGRRRRCHCSRSASARRGERPLLGERLGGAAQPLARFGPGSAPAPAAETGRN